VAALTSFVKDIVPLTTSGIQLVDVRDIAAAHCQLLLLGASADVLDNRVILAGLSAVATTGEYAVGVGRSQGADGTSATGADDVDGCGCRFFAAIRSHDGADFGGVDALHHELDRKRARVMPLCIIAKSTAPCATPSCGWCNAAICRRCWLENLVNKNQAIEK